jgi:hypothetical protein
VLHKAILPPFLIIPTYLPTHLLTYSPLHITCSEHSTVETNAIKILDVQLDSQLSWKSHVNYLLHKLSSVCYIMRRLFHVLNIQTLRTIYSVHFHSLVYYGVIFWGNTSSIYKVILTKKKKKKIL